MLLGEILIMEGLCTEGDVLEALSAQNAGESAKIGEILLRRGILSLEDLEQALFIQSRIN
jgi:hypothetical protein